VVIGTNPLPDRLRDVPPRRGPPGQVQ